jgi:6-pyruvoyltetrahydropterin/6-carboxytetrahydropterin synthase
MYKLSVRSEFSAAHKLTGYEGQCKNLHGHNWKVKVSIFCDVTDDIGLTIDFGIVKKDLNEIMDSLDHTYLNELTVFEGRNPTSENIAKFIFDEFKKKLDKQNAKVAKVEVWESDKTSMTYFEK